MMKISSCYRNKASKRSSDERFVSYNPNKSHNVVTENGSEFENIERRLEQEMNPMDKKNLRGLDWKETMTKSNKTPNNLNNTYRYKIRRFEKLRTVLVVLLTVLFSNSKNLTHAADDDGNADDAMDDIFDDYYDEGNFNNVNYDDAYFDSHNAMDDVINALDDFYIQEDDYVDIMENGNYGFDELSFMPISCIQYNNGHMVKFELFENTNNYQCHFKNLGTYVVSIAHFMRAFFNQQALLKGNEFELPGDAGYLNCVMLQQTAYANQKLYAKIGCMDRETFTSTKLQLHIYTDKKCTEKYDDGLTDRYHSTKGYEINGYTFSTRTSFRPPFYSCQNCIPNQISESFKKKNYWYDDDYISQYGKKNNAANNDDGDDDNDDQNDQADDDAAAVNDDAAAVNDDAQALDDKVYYAANDDGDDYRADDGGQVVANDDDFYKYKDDDAAGANDGNRRRIKERNLIKSYRSFVASDGKLEQYHESFWNEVEETRRSLENNNGIGDWNFCERIYKYGIWCDAECRAIDTFRVDEWSNSDIFLLVIMCFFMAAMMLLIFAKRVKAYEKARIFEEVLEAQYPGLPPMAMALLFIVIIAIILTLASLKFVNETLVFAVVQCILLFIYMLKLTLFERQTPSHLLSMRKNTNQRLNSMNRHLFDS